MTISLLLEELQFCPHHCHFRRTILFGRVSLSCRIISSKSCSILNIGNDSPGCAVKSLWFGFKQDQIVCLLTFASSGKLNCCLASVKIAQYVPFLTHVIAVWFSFFYCCIILCQSQLSGRWYLAVIGGSLWLASFFLFFPIQWIIRSRHFNW